MNTWQKWLYHLVSAGIAGAASSVGACFVSPSTFNVTSAQGWAHIGELALFGFATPVLQILKDGLPQVTTSTVTVTTTETNPAPSAQKANTQ
jgi:hypothetical protein